MSIKDWIFYGYILLTFVALLMLLGNLLVNFIFFRRPVNSPQGELNGNCPKISVCIPARNESLRIGNLLRSLSLQDYPDFEVIVLNDRSEDDTAFILQSWAKDLPQLKVIAGEKLPEGWVGKCWACHQLSSQATGEYLLFTDADTVFHPLCLSTALKHARDTDAALMSLWPMQVAGTWSEKLIIPFVYLLLLVFLPHALVNRVRNAGLGAANGQFIFYRRKDYFELGGHETVKNHLVEDVALARACLRAGRRLVNADGTDLVSCRMYHRFLDLWEGFTKNLRAAFEKSVGAFLFFGFLQLAVFVMPFLLLLIMMTRHGWDFIGTPIGTLLVLQIALIYLIRLIFSLRYRQSVVWALAHPFGQVLALVIAMNSWIQTSFLGGVKWKGRTYRPLG